MFGSYGGGAVWSRLDSRMCHTDSSTQPTKDTALARPNHQFEKRQRELAKQKKKEEKRLRKLEKTADGEDTEAAGTVEGEASEEPAE